MADDRPGFEDTPLLPESEYRVHDPERPYPESVTPAGPVTQSPPSDATVLFHGTDLSAWESVDGGDPKWTVEDDGTFVVDPPVSDP